MTLEEIKQEVKRHLQSKGSWMQMESVKERFFIFKGIERLQLETKGNVIDVVTTVVNGYGERDKLPVKVIKMDSMSSEELLETINSYSDSVSVVEREWNEILLEVKAANMSILMGKTGVESILYAALDGVDDVRYEVKVSGPNKVEVQLGANNWRREISLILDPQDAKMPEIVQQMADSIKTMKQDAPSVLRKAVCRSIDNQEGRPLCWYFNTYLWEKMPQKQYQEKCDAVVSAGIYMPFVAVPTTQQQLFNALKDAGIGAKLVDSCYSYGQKDIEITSGAFRIIITNGKIPGMLVACSPFFCVSENSAVNICVSHRPIDQVVNWVKNACQEIRPIADEIMGEADLLTPRYSEYQKANEMLSEILALPGITGHVNECGVNCKLVINDCNHIEVDCIEIESESPIKTAAAVKAMAEMLSAVNV